MSSVSNTAELTTTLPSSWYRADDFYQLERRAIWAQKWLLATHVSRLQEAGGYIKFDVAGYSYFLIKDKNNDINGFLNVCRHRAYPVVTQQEGTAKILACKYHGWSYGINGKLAKAPRFETVEGFDKNEFSLFSIHTHVDKRGFIWVNLDSSPEPATSWDAQLGGTDLQPRLERFNMDDFTFDHTWSITGDFNWKTLVDNYNECYHCFTAHPGIAPFINKYTKFDNGLKKGYIEHYAEANFGEMVTSPTFFFPNATITMTDKFWYLMRIAPVSETATVLEYDFFRHKDTSVDEFNELVDYFKQIENEDKDLSNNAQKNLNSETYVAGPLHTYMESAVIYFQKLVKAAVFEHRSKEKQQGGEINPARRGLPLSRLEQEEMFCKEICSDARVGAVEQTAW